MKKKKKNTLYENLELLKTELFDSPDEIKGAFNVLISYFDTPDVFKACEKGFPTQKAEEIMQRIADNPYGSHNLISKCTNLSSRFLEKLSRHKDFSVRSAVALNPNTPKEIIIKLSEDKDWRVSNSAKQRLNN